MKQSLPVEPERQQKSHSHLMVNNTSLINQAFIDNRESTAMQRQLMSKLTNSPQVIAQRKISEQINNSPRMLVQRRQVSVISGNAVQRVEGEEELLQGKFKTIQREEDEELLQGKFGTAQLEQAPIEKANNTGLPDNLKQGIENLSGMSMDNVKVHYNSPKPAQLNALAYAQGTDIHLGAGQEKHLPHEAWHVVQQAQGRVKPTMQMREGVPVNDDQALEHEADVMGARAVQMKTVYGSSPNMRFFHAASSVVIQRHHNLKLNDPYEDKAHIYKVVQESDDEIVYIGQTCDQVGLDARFQQHLESGYHNNWSDDTHRIEAIWTSVMTQFETTTSEQYYIDQQGGITNLENSVNALTSATFDKYVDDKGNPRWGKTYRPKTS